MITKITDSEGKQLEGEELKEAKKHFWMNKNKLYTQVRPRRASNRIET